MGNKKGGSFEREVSKQLSLWITNGERDDVFWRTHGSGARHTVRFQKGKETAGQDGDIQSTHPLGEEFRNIFSIECKFYKDLNLWSIITGAKDFSIYQYWKDTIEVSERVNKEPLLIAKQNNKPVLFVVSRLMELHIRSAGLMPKFKFCLGTGEEAAAFIFDEIKENIKADVLIKKILIHKNAVEKKDE